MNSINVHRVDPKIMRKLVNAGFIFNPLSLYGDGWIELPTENISITFFGKLEEETEDDVKDCKEV